MKNARLFWRLSGWFLMAAMFLGFGGGTLRAEDDIYELVTDASTLRAGDEVLIVAKKNAYYAAMTAASNRAGTRIESKMNEARDQIINPTIATQADETEACVLTLEKNAEGKYAFKDKVNDKYLATENSDNLATSDEACYFNVTISDQGVVTMHEPIRSRYVICYYLAAPLFRAYTTNATSSSKLNVNLYKKKVETPPDPATPYIINMGKTEESYTIQPTDNLDVNLFFRAGNLEDKVEVAVASADEGREDAVISVEPEEISQADANAAPIELTLTTSNLSIGEYTDIITLESGDAKVEVTVNLSVKKPDIYQLVTNAASLRAGNEVLIVAEGGYAMTASGTEQNSSREGVKVTVADNAITNPDIATVANQKKACVFTLEKDADGNYAFNDNLNAKKYLTSPEQSYNSNAASSTTPSYFSVTINATTGAATVVIPVNGSNRYMRYRTDDGEFRLLANAASNENVYLYKKQVADEPTCDPVTLSDDGAAEPGENDVTLTWDAPTKGAPANGYRVTVKGPKDYNKTVTVANTQTQIDWEAELEPETEYSFEIVSLCGEDNESDPVVGKFTTAHSTKPILDIQSPADNTVFTGDVTFVFTTKGFTVDATHLVKAEVRAKVTTDQAAAPIIQTVYTQAEALTITGLADGKYHVDLFMVEITDNGGKKDTTVVGFDGDNYVHRDIEVKHPALNFSAQNLKLTTYRGTSVEGKVTLTGVALPSTGSVSLNSNNPNITVAPTSLTRAKVMTGAEITVTFNGAAANATATIMAIFSGDAKPATLTVNAIARDTLANLKGIYSRVANDTVQVRGKMVVTHKDTTNSRVWVQDIDKETGASMLLYNVTNAKGYNALKVGDVLKNVAGRVTISNGLYRFTPLANLTPEERGHAVYVDTMSLLEVRANSNKAEAQSALVCIKDVKFKQTGNFAANRNYALLQGQGKDTLAFRGYTMADYIGKPIPTARLYVTAIVGHDNGARVSARSLADMVNAPCLMPENITADAHENEAELDWDGLADNYAVRYATVESALESAAPISVDKSSCHITNLTANTTYYYQVKSVCGTDGYESEWSAVKSFTTLAAGLPSIRMTSPVEFPVFTDSVKVSFRVNNVTLKASDTSARIVFSDGFTVNNYTDTVYKRAMPSGDYSVQVILVKDGQPLTPSVQTQVRYFSVDLPDVAAPVFTPKAGRYKDLVEVTLSCATQGAKIFYAKGEGEWVAYTAGSKIVLEKTTTLKAFACKDRMDTSAVVPATYTIYSNLKPEGDLVFEENFSKSKTASTDAISNFDEVTDMPGWSGANMYPEVGKIKGGTVSRAGKLVSPAINLSNDNGKYYVAFFVQAYNNSADSTKIRLTAGDQSVLVSGLDKTGMSEYVYLFNNGTDNTQITFEALAANYNRFYLDSIRVYQVLPGVPRLTVSPSVFEMNTAMGTPVSEKITVKGNLLSEDVAVSLLQANENFSVSATTLAAADVMGENGAELTVTFNASVAEDSVKMELVSGELSQTVMVKAFATPVVEECEAPTQLNAAVADKSVTLTWNGATDKYRVVVLGEKEVCNEFVTGKNYSLNNLEVGTYAWMVASVCENGEQWANGENFEVKPVSNDDAEELAFRIYPNPTAGVFYVEVAEGARMEIFTLGGVTVRNEMLKAGKNEIRLDRSGIYFVRLTNATGSAVQRLIVL